MEKKKSVDLGPLDMFLFFYLFISVTELIIGNYERGQLYYVYMQLRSYAKKCCRWINVMLMSPLAEINIIVRYDVTFRLLFYDHL